MLRGQKFWKGRSRKFWKVIVGSRKFWKVGVGFGYFISDSATLVTRHQVLLFFGYRTVVGNVRG